MSFPRYEQYKDSGVEWLGEVPQHWLERDAEIDEDAVGDLSDADLDDGALEAKPRRQNRNEHPCIEAVEDDLEDAVEGNKPGNVARVAPPASGAVSVIAGASGSSATRRRM